MPMTLDEMMTAIGRAEKAGDKAAADWMRSQAQEQLTGKAGIWANVGAGASNLVEGAKGLIGLGMSDDELREKRRIDEMAARSTPGGDVAQFAGEVLPTLAIPGGAGARVLIKALGRAPTAAGRVSLPIAMGGSALESGAVSALTPTTADESPLSNIGTGTGFGAGAPLLPKALGAGWRGARAVADRALAAAPGQLGANAAGRVGTRLAETGLEHAGVPLQPGRYAAQDYQPNTAPIARSGAQLEEFAPTTAAAYHQTPQLAAVEKAVRTFDAPSWSTRDAAEQGKRWSRLDENLRGQPDIDAALSRADALDPPYTVSPRKFDTQMAGFTRDLENMVDSPAYIANPTVRSTVDMLRRQIDSNTITPETLHEFRKVLTAGLAGPPGAGEAVVRAARSDRNLMQLVNRIDNVMENSAYSGQQRNWGNWRRDYSAEMAQAEGAKAEEMLRGRFVDEGGRSLTGTGGVPALSAPALTRARDALGRVEGGPGHGRDQFTPQARQAIGDILQDLDAAGVVKRVEQAATLGGSATAYNLATAGITGVIADMVLGSMGALGAGALIAARSKNAVEEARRRILSGIMQDPAQFRQFVAAAAQRAQQEAARAGISANNRMLGRYGAVGAAAAPPLLETDQKQ